MKITITIFLLISLTFQQCSNGCLKCSATNACQVCDTLKSYYLNVTACVISSLTNCKVLGQSGSCVLCNTGFYLGLGTLNCVAVPTASIVTNCAIYSAAIACSVCNSGFFINTTLCSAVNITVTNCAAYSTNGVCSACMTGFVFSYDNTLCVAVPSTGNCLGYTYAACAFCNSGFTLNVNMGMTNLISSITLSTMVAYVAAFNNPMALSVCQAITVINCLTISSFNTCTVCVAGYYLSAGSCVLNPISTILNCSTYISLTQCLSCNNNFYLSGNTNGNTCVAITTIPTCQSYNTFATSSLCIQCNSTAFVSSNTCSNRTTALNVANCAAYNLTADQCLTCASGYSLTSNFWLCLPNIPNCATTSWSSGQTVFTCTVCNDTFVLATGSNSCVIGTLANCRQYSSSTVCATCLNKYYLNTASSPSVCTAQVAITNCVTYDPVNFNACSVCAQGYFLFGYYQTCIAVASGISNCVTYSTDGTACVTCSTGYYVGLGLVTCVLIPTTSNCLIYTIAAGCTTCATGYVILLLPTPATCVTVVDYVTKNCDTTIALSGTVSWSLSTNFCLSCKANFVPYAPISVEAICVLSTDLAVYSTYTTTQAANCVRFGLNQLSPQNVICQQCASQFFLTGYDIAKEKSVMTTCVATCVTTAAANMIIMDDLIGSVNICIPSNSLLATLNCQRLARVMYYSNLSSDYYCNQAIATFGFALTLNVTGSMYFYPFEAVSTAITTPVTTSIDYYHGFGQVDQSSIIPSIFGYRGILVTSTPTNQTLNLQFSAALANCEINFNISSDASMYNTSGAVNGYYVMAAANSFLCNRCIPGYQPVFTLISAGATAGNNPIPVCTAMTNCASNVIFYGGLPTYLNSFLSCHSCLSGSTVLYPTLNLEINAQTGKSGEATQYLLFNQITTTTAGFGCFAAPTTVSINLVAPVANNQVTNCAVFASVGFLASTKLSPVSFASFCLACSTGFFPTYFAATGTNIQTSTASNIFYYAMPYIVTSCTASANCNAVPSNKIFNSCGQCSTASNSAFPPVYYAYTDFRLANCYQSLTPNCFILGGNAILSTSAGNACTVCMSGFILNQDGYCDKYSTPNSASTASFVKSYYANTNYIPGNRLSGFDAIQVRNYYLLSFSGLQYGTTSCNTNYILAPPALLSPVLCVQSSYMSNSVTKLTGTKFITNCIRYKTTIPGTGLALGCFACATGYIPLQDNSACVATIVNCQFAVVATPNKCSTCLIGYLNVNGACSSAVIANCAVYSNTLTSFTLSALSCLTCAVKYTLLKNNICSLGLVQNCNAYSVSSLYSCSVCATGFSLMTMSVSQSYCYPIPAAFNCNLVATNTNSPFGYAQGIINCQTCISTVTVPLKISIWNSANTLTLAQNTCLPFNAISNCATYTQPSVTLLSNTFLCNNCTSGYYLSADSTACITRLNTPSGCLYYLVSADQCAMCGVGLFLNSTATGCTAYPIGIPSCQNYTSASTCSMCISGWYLSANACILSTVITNCMTYSANYTCTVCISGYYLSTSILCVQATAINCLTYSSASVCATCAFGSTVVAGSSPGSCTAIVVANCALLSLSNQNNCGYCNNNYYLNSAGVCVSVTNQISNCLYFASATTCMNCSATYTLSVDTLTCVNTYTNATDVNCASAALLGTPACSMCSFGYTFVNGVCTAGLLYSSGCALTDQNNATNCLICLSGYYQTASSLCVSMIAPVTTATTTTTTSASVIAVKVLAVMGLLLIGFSRKMD